MPTTPKLTAVPANGKPADRVRVRIVEVLVQPVVVLDYGDRLEKVEHPAVTIPAEEWPTYSSERFPREVAVWEEQLNTPEKPVRERPPRKAPAKRPAAKRGQSGNPAKRAASKP